MSKTLTHIAGPRLTIDGRVIQRCMLCGINVDQHRRTPAGISNLAGRRPGAS